MSAPLISASLLAASPLSLGHDIRTLVDAGVEGLHIDIMDGHFVPNLGLSFDQTNAVITLSPVPCWAHLMVMHPEKWIDQCARANVTGVMIHPEATLHPHRCLQMIREAGMEAGIALNPGTPTHILDPLWDVLDHVLSMTVNPGFCGQRFLESQTHKLKHLGALCQQEGCRFHVDGGINENSIRHLQGCQVTDVVVGSALFQEDIMTSVKKIRDALDLLH